MASGAQGSVALGASASNVSALASTGSDALGLGAIAALLGLLGTVLLFGAANRERRHRTR
jgi:hypothetical protein